MSKTKTHIELEVDIEYDFHPEEPATQEYPGCEAAVEINEILVCGTDILGDLTSDQMDALEQHCMECEVKEVQ